MAADHGVVLAHDESVGIVPAALPGHVRVAGPSGRPELDDWAKCAATHGPYNHPLMKIIPDNAMLRQRVPAATLVRTDSAQIGTGRSVLVRELTGLRRAVIR